MEELCFQVPRHLIWKKTPKKRRNRHLRVGKCTGHPKHDPRFGRMAMRPKCGLGAPSVEKITLGHLKCDPGTNVA